AFGDESATFTLLAQFRNLMSDASSSEFRFFQVIYFDDEPTTWNGSLITWKTPPGESGTPNWLAAFRAASTRGAAAACPTFTTKPWTVGSGNTPLGAPKMPPA